jgi:hypothetical protein
VTLTAEWIAAAKGSSTPTISVIAIANCNGNRVAVNSYDECGIPLELTTGSAPNTGKEQDRDKFRYIRQVR